MNYRKALDDLKESSEILELNIGLFYDGKTSAYRVIAVQLRLLLCDGNQSLVPRVFKNVRLHPLWGGISKEQDAEWKNKFGHSFKDGLVFQMPAMVEFDGKGGSKVIKLFDERREPIELQEWLDQDLFSKEITIRKLIRSVADKLAAHSDPEYGDTLNYTRTIKLVNEDIHKQFIVAIGEYVLRLIQMALQGNARYLD